MINKSDSISVIHMVLIAITSIGLKNHVFAISPLILTSGRDAWITVLMTILPIMVWTLLLIYINRKTNRQPLLVWMSNIIGVRLTKLLAFSLICYLIILSSVTLKETITWTNITFLPRTPPTVLVIVFMVTCLLLAASQFRTVTILNVFLLFFVVIFGLFVAIANIQHKNFALLLPIMEHGYSRIFDGMIFQASGMSEMLIFVVLQHKLNAPIRFRHLFVLTLILTGLTLGPLVGAIIEFGPTEASIQRFPPYEEWGLVSIGRYIEHVDFLSIYQWLTGAFIRISLFLYTIRELTVLSKQSNRWKSSALLLASVSIAVLTLLPITDPQFTTLLTKLLLPATFWMFFTLSIFLCLLAFIEEIRKRRWTNEL